ncbi:MAG: immune inhibitor A, partial [Anaerolineales bacterium]|nr:immune inhibitor A [Anaerolineales bacterium]
MDSYQPNSNPNPNRKFFLACGGCLGISLVLFACLGIFGFIGYTYWQENGGDLSTQIAQLVETVTVTPQSTPRFKPTVTPADPVIKPSATATAVPNTKTIPTPTALPVTTPLSIPVPDSIIQTEIPANAYRDLEKLYSAEYPPNDYFAAAIRLGKENLSERTISSPAYQVGDTQTFITDDGSIQATLLAATDHTYFWVENGLDIDEKAITTAANRLETEYYPLLVNLFGQEWQPGVDNDPHFSILHLRLPVDASELGFFTSLDEYPRAMYSDSNQQEVVYLNMAAMDVGEDIYYGTMVHEVQHLIQWNIDPNEATWLNEGLSQLAEIYMGLNTADAYYYMRQPDIRLNTWEYDEDVVDAHYSGAYLFCVYLWEQLGETAVQELSRHPANDMSGVRSVLQGYGERSLEDFMADWAAANWLDDRAVGNAYGYDVLDPGEPDLQMRIRQFPYERTDALPQYGVHYYALSTTGKATISFAGDTLTDLMGAAPLSGRQVWFAPAMDETDASLTLHFDLTDLSTATLAFNAWYDLEEDWDFAYVSISTDNGTTWDLLSPEHLSAGDYGPAFNGCSDAEHDAINGWVEEAINLNPYAGQDVLVRFEALTDSSITGQGFAVDDVHVPEMSAVKALDTLSNWEAAGFVQTGWQLPQQWRVQLI